MIFRPFVLTTKLNGYKHKAHLTLCGLLLHVKSVMEAEIRAVWYETTVIASLPHEGSDFFFSSGDGGRLIVS